MWQVSWLESLAQPLLTCVAGQVRLLRAILLLQERRGLRIHEVVQQAQASTIHSVTLSQQEVTRALTQNRQAFGMRGGKWHLRAAATMS